MTANKEQIAAKIEEARRNKEAMLSARATVAPNMGASACALCDKACALRSSGECPPDVVESKSAAALLADDSINIVTAAPGGEGGFYGQPDKAAAMQSAILQKKKELPKPKRPVAQQKATQLERRPKPQGESILSFMGQLAAALILPPAKAK